MTTLQRVRSRSRVERHLSTMFEDSVFADLSLGFIHPAYPFTMRFDVHKSIVSQSAFFYRLIQNHNHELMNSDKDGVTESRVLTVDLALALSHCGFVLAPFQHIIRRKWQKSPSTATNSKQANSLTQNLLASHIRFALRWMYAHDRHDMMTDLEEQDTLRVLAMAVLFGLDDLATRCVERYIKRQLSMETIMRDLEHICQLPRNHHAYLQLRDAALLLLLRHGADDPENLSDLPVDYMADVLSADMLFVGCEYDRYCLIREVLSMFMRSVGQITWTHLGPVDQDLKRLSGFVRPVPVTASDVRSRKRKRIPSEELLPERATKLARLSFSATVPFQTLIADAASGGVIDKATVLSHLLKTTVHYSNMTFDQLSKVRQDGIVDDEIVFRALWQREAFERLLIPSMRVDQSDEERRAALDDYFDVNESDDHRRQLLLGTPRYRFCASVPVTKLGVEHGWQLVEQCQEENDLRELEELEELEKLELGIEDDPEEEEEIVDVTFSDDDKKVGELAVATPEREECTDSQSLESLNVWEQKFYSQPVAIWGMAYRVRIEAQVVPDKLAQLDDDEADEEEEGSEEPKKVLLCKFELERSPKVDSIPARRRKSRIPVRSRHSSPEDVVETQPLHPPQPMHHPLDRQLCSAPSQFTSEVARKPPRIRYTVHCLNQREGSVEHRRVDPEDRVLVAVTDHTDGDSEASNYAGQIRIEGYDPNVDMRIDVVVCLEVPGLGSGLTQ